MDKEELFSKINEIKDETVEKALTKSNNKIVDQLFTYKGVNFDDVKKNKKLEALAQKRAERHGKSIVEDPDTGEHKHVVKEELVEAIKALIEGREDGESIRDYKERLATEKTPKMKAVRRHLDKEIKKTESEYKNNKKETAELKSKSDKAWDDYNKAAKKDDEAYKDYKSTVMGTELNNKMFSKWRKASDKLTKAGEKHNKASDATHASREKGYDLIDKGSETAKKRNDLNSKIAHIKGRYYHTDRDFKSESLDLEELKLSILEDLNNIFEYGDVNPEGGEKEVNKIKKTSTDKHGNKVDVVSVEDELFPKEGNAKQQFNQKIIAKINDMIEGKATLEDLLQLTRQKLAARKAKATNESLTISEQIINEVSAKFFKDKLVSSTKIRKENDEQAEKNPTKDNLDKAAKYNHKEEVVKDHVENYLKDKAEKELNKDKKDK